MTFTPREVDEIKAAEVCNITSVSSTNPGVVLLRARIRLRVGVEKKDFKRS